MTKSLILVSSDRLIYFMLRLFITDLRDIKSKYFCKYFITSVNIFRMIADVPILKYGLSDNILTY